MNIYNEKLSIIMPAYNEGENIYKNLLETVEVVSGFHNNFEIIAVNDGSDDDTQSEMLRATKQQENIIVVSYEMNLGKGKAIKEGVLRASGKYIAFLDSDLDLSPFHLRDFLGKMEMTGVDAVIGSKLHRDSQVDYPKRRKIMSVGYYLVLIILFHLPVKDTQTGVKLFQAERLKEIIDRVESVGYTYDIEILANLAKSGGKIEEMPIVLNFQRENRWGRIKLVDVLYVIKDTIRVYKTIHGK